MGLDFSMVHTQLATRHIKLLGDCRSPIAEGPIPGSQHPQVDQGEVPWALHHPRGPSSPVFTASSLPHFEDITFKGTIPDGLPTS